MGARHQDRINNSEVALVNLLLTVLYLHRQCDY